VLAHYGATHSTVIFYRPNGIRGTLHAPDFHDKYEGVAGEQAETLWRQGYERAGTTCIHGPSCKGGQSCTAGKRHQVRSFFTGPVLPRWRVLERFFVSNKDKIKVARLVIDGRRHVGVELPRAACHTLMAAEKDNQPDRALCPKGLPDGCVPCEEDEDEGSDGTGDYGASEDEGAAEEEEADSDDGQSDDEGDGNSKEQRLRQPSFDDDDPGDGPEDASDDDDFA